MPSIGVGVEAAYTAAKNKPSVYLRSLEGEPSTTVEGISNRQIFL